MARYIRTNIASRKRNPVGNFVGWDNITGRSNEATDAENLGLMMTERAQRIFLSLQPGETKSSGLFDYFKEY